MKTWICWLLVAAPLFGVALVLGVSAAEWKLVRSRIQRSFPDVRQIGTGELAAWLAAKDRKKPVLLDVRTKEEFEVSHIDGALRVEPGSDPARLDLHIGRDEPVVTYCSVGYRSSEFAQRLQHAGYRDVRNLDGSIFQWANEDRALTSGGKPASVVHPYNRMWGAMLKKERRAVAPEMK